jgi:hypothetical protein
MKTRANLGRMSLVLLGLVPCFADFVSAAQGTKNANTDNQRTGAVTGQLAATFGNQVVYGSAETVTLTPLSGGQTITTKTNDLELGRVVAVDRLLLAEVLEALSQKIRANRRLLLFASSADRQVQAQRRT